MLGQVISLFLRIFSYVSVTVGKLFQYDLKIRGYLNLTFDYIILIVGITY